MISHEYIWSFERSKILSVKSVLSLNKESWADTFEARLNSLQKLIKPLQLQVAYYGEKPDSWGKYLIIAHMVEPWCVGLGGVGSTDGKAPLDYTFELSGRKEQIGKCAGVSEQVHFRTLVSLNQPEIVIERMKYLFEV